MAKNNQQLSETRRNDADEMALALGFRSKKDPKRGSHRALETEMLRRWRSGESVSVIFSYGVDIPTALFSTMPPLPKFESSDPRGLGEAIPAPAAEAELMSESAANTELYGTTLNPKRAGEL